VTEAGAARTGVDTSRPRRPRGRSSGGLGRHFLLLRRRTRCRVKADSARRVGGGTQHPGPTRARRGFAVATLLAVAIVPAYGDAAPGDICDGCALFLGIGYTYHMWGETAGFVIPATLSLDQSPYEVGVFRFTSDQSLYEDLWGRSRVLPSPYLGGLGLAPVATGSTAEPGACSLVSGPRTKRRKTS
jgi:hypothetical protein